MSKQCVTHHFACDCREEMFKELERENAALRVRLDAASKHSALAVTLLAQAQVELVETRHNLNKPKEAQL